MGEYAGDGRNPSVTALSGRATSLNKGGKELLLSLAPLLRGLSAKLTGGFPPHKLHYPPAAVQSEPLMHTRKCGCNALC